jgi:hypothetical protein
MNQDISINKATGYELVGRDMILWGGDFFCLTTISKLAVGSTQVSSLLGVNN